MKYHVSVVHCTHLTNKFVAVTQTSVEKQLEHPRRLLNVLLDHMLFLSEVLRQAPISSDTVAQSCVSHDHGWPQQHLVTVTLSHLQLACLVNVQKASSPTPHS